MVSIPLRARTYDIYRQIESDKMSAIASSTNRGNNAVDAVNGKGMTGDRHVANNPGDGMWLSGKSTKPTSYCHGLPKGIAWLVCDLDTVAHRPVAVDQIGIWNYNQNLHTRRGLKKVLIYHSIDGKSWTLLPGKEHEYHIIPESKGRNPEACDYVFAFEPVKAAYFCFIADSHEGNYYDMTDEIVAKETKDLKQNQAYYGVSEIRFYKKTKQDITLLPRITTVTPLFTQGYRRSPDGPRREFKVDFDTPLYTGGRLLFTLGSQTWVETIAPDANGTSSFTGLCPAGYMPESQRLEVTLESSQGNVSTRCDVPAARQWTVAFFPHSHQDIGYTHRQDDVMKLQWRNLERAMDLADRTRHYPEQARFHWNTEATWSVMGYLDAFRGTDKAARLIDAIKRGDICVNSPLGSELTGIMRQEELMHVFDDAHAIRELTGVPCHTAMMSDVPGQTWGLSTAMAFNDVKYFSPGPNYVPFYGRIGNDRAGALHIDWGDRPFYWTSQSGKEKVLVWQAGRGYSWFHGWLAGRLAVCGLEPIWQYLGELEATRFPYDECYLRYTIYGDNGPPDELMPDIIRRWNDEYDSPRFVIANSNDFFEEFESRYGDVLPSYGGDMTPTWEDGAASTARETAMNRESAARLSHAGIMHALYGGEGSRLPLSQADEAWKNIILFSEHTWGSASSGPEPNSQFTRDLWDVKKAFADSGDIQSRRLFFEALPIDTSGNFVHVVNTLSWNRTDVVKVNGTFDGNRQMLVDATGRIVPVQNMSDGTWIFIAEDVPALSSAVYSIVPKKGTKATADHQWISSDSHSIDNGIIRVNINPDNGTISSLKWNNDDFEYVAGDGLNDFLYTGHLGANPRGIKAVKSIELTDAGVVGAAITITSDAPGCESLKRQIFVYRGLPRVDVLNTIDKTDILERENVRFIFPFNFPHPDIALDLPMSLIHPEREQLEGVNKHYYSILNGISVGDLEHGLCLLSPDAPFIELGSPSGEAYRLNPRHGYGWWPSAQISPVVYSWVMTNTWRTNYKASQGGVARFRYSLLPGNPHDLCLKLHGQECEHPLVAFKSADSRPAEQLLRIKGNNQIEVASLTPSKDNRGYIIRLHNMDKKVARASIVWGKLATSSMSRCTWDEKELEQVDPNDLWMQPYEYATFKIITQ